MPGPDSNSLKKIKAGEDSRLNWKTINQCVDHLSSLTRADADRRLAIAELRRIRKDSGSGTAEVGMFLLKEVHGDYLTCHTWDGSTEGSTDIYIAKDPALRRSVTSELLDDVTVSYSYTSDVVRVASWTVDSVSDSETQHVVPHYQADADEGDGEVIFAISAAHTGVDVDGTELTWMEIRSGRAWARSYIQ